MIIQIGIIAGDIWHYLESNETATLDLLVKETDKPRELVLMSLGWLAREGHITLGSTKDGYVAALLKK